MLRKFSWTAVRLLALPLLGGCGAGGPETATVTKSDASQVAPSRYAAPEPAAMSETTKSSRQSLVETAPYAGASAAPALGIPAPIPAPADEGQGPGKGGDKFAYSE